MLEVEWSGGEDFTEELGEAIADGQTPKGRMFHGTIDLICSSDDDSDSEMAKTGSEATLPDETHVEATEVCPEVVDVVNEMLNFVERNSLIPEFGYDPEPLIKEEVFIKKEGSCNKPHCLKGCLCSSLGGRFPHGPTHCGRERCMFECTCQERGLLTIDDENHYTDKSKRKKKLPTRFKDVVLGKAYEKLHARSIHDQFNGINGHSESDDECHQMTERMKTPSAGSSKNPSPELKKDSTDSGYAAKKKSNNLVSFEKVSIATVRKTIQERRVGFLSKTLNEEQTLADVQIWCTHHDKYSCLCINYVFFQKTNALLWKPSNASRYLANKVMYDIALKAPTQMFHEVYPYNHNMHSARTQGPLTNYMVRNKDEVFQTKRKLEIEYNVLSYSNSYMKFYVRKYPCVTKTEAVPSAEPYDKSLEVKGGMGSVVRMIRTKEKLILDVGEENLDVKVDYVIDEDEHEVGEDGECRLEKAKLTRRRRKPTMKMIQLEEERKRELLDLESPEKEEPVKVPVVVPPPVLEKKKRRGRKPKHLVMMERRASELSDRSTIREPTPEVDIIRCSSQTADVKGVEVKVGMRKCHETAPVSIKEEPSSPDYFSAESRMELEDAKEEAIVCAPDIGLVASCAPSRTSDTTHVTTTAPSVSPCSSKTDKDRREEEFREDIPKPFLGFSDGNENTEFEEIDDPDNDDPDSIHTKKVLILKPRKDGYPHTGLMCLTPGLGYVTVLEYLPSRIVICDPAAPDVKKTFADLSSVNGWLNAYIRGKVAISPPDLVLQWILVKPGILKLKQVKPLDPTLFWNPAVIVTPNGIVNKKSLESPLESSLKKIVSEHSVFSPVIRKQLAVREAATTLLKNFVSNPKFCTSNLVPNPKSKLRRLLKRQLPDDEKSDVPAPKMAALSESSVSFETADGCLTVHRLSTSDSDVKIWTPSSVFSPVKPPSLDLTPRDLAIHHQVTIRPLPSLTKITPLQNFKHVVKIQK